MIKPRIRKNIFFDSDVAQFLDSLRINNNMTFSYLVNMICRLYIESTNQDV